MPSLPPAAERTAAPVVARLLTLSREAGTDDCRAARELVAAHLRSLGYEVELQRFSFSPGTLDAFPIFGTGLGGLGVAMAPALASASAPAWLAVALLFLGTGALVLLAAGIALGWGPAGHGAREDANLIAVRPGATVRRWVVAHLDTKAQRQSMAGRLVAVWICAAALLMLTALAGLRLAGPVSAVSAGGGAVIAVLAGALASRGRLRGKTVGARDNGSGLVAALGAAEAADDGSLGVLITGAEEFGLVGARIFARDRLGALRGTEVINVDTVDDRGPLFVIAHDAAGRELARRVGPMLAGLGEPVRARSLPLGVFVDSYPLARAGVPAITLGRVTWSTLRLLHTPGDTMDGLHLDFAARLGAAIARMN